MAADSVHGGLAGRSWDALKNWELGAANQGGVRGSPTPMEDVMKLRREDMNTLGRCPAWDNFTLVTCDKCNRNVKIEALESHVAMRHSSKSERSAYHRVTAARAAALLNCQVRLTSASTSPQHTSLLERLSDPRTLPTSTSGSSLGSAGPASPQAHGSQQVESTTPTRTPSPVLIPDEREELEPMETSPSPPPHPPSPLPLHTIKQKPPYMVSDESDREREKEKERERDREKGRERDKERNREKERVKERPTFRGNNEADSTTNNVISIPESEDMPNIEIISDGMDLLNTKFSFSSTTPQQPLQTQAVPPETPLPQTSTPGRQPITPRPSPAPSNRTPATEPMEVDQNAPPAPTHYITVSPLGKCGGSPRKLVIGRLPAPQEKKVTGREREYDPNRYFNDPNRIIGTFWATYVNFFAKNYENVDIFFSSSNL